MNGMSQVLCMVLAGGTGDRLSPLTLARSKPGIPFAGKYRIIDFVMSNLINSGAQKIHVLTQYRFQSVKTQIEKAFPSTPYGHYITTEPVQQKTGVKWFEGTADAILENWDITRNYNFETMAIFAADHIYTMNVEQMYLVHNEKKSDFTICVMPYRVEEAAGQLGVLEVDEEFRVIGFKEKPDLEDVKEIPGRPGWCLASMGNYLANTSRLLDVLIEDSKDSGSKHDFGKNIIPLMLEKAYNIFVYNYPDNTIIGKDVVSWDDVGTFSSYWKTNIEAAKIKPPINLKNPYWPIITVSTANLDSAKFCENPRINDSIIGDGCIVNDCTILESVLSPNVRVEDGASIEESIIFSRNSIGRGVRLKKVIIDKDVHIPEGTVLGPHMDFPEDHPIKKRDGVLVVPKGCDLRRFNLNQY